MVEDGEAGPLARRRQGDHDHRHLSESRDRARSKLGDADVTINGIAKGAGMIAPDMATMLSFVATDAPIAAPVLQALLSKGVGADLQRRHRRQRHLDQRHAAAVRHRCGGQARRAAIADAEGPAARGLQARR